MYVQENQRNSGYHKMPKPVHPKVAETNRFLDEVHGVNNNQHEINPDWRKVKLSQQDLIVLTTSTTKSYIELGLPRSPSNYAEVMKLNQLKIDEQCKIARERGLPIVLGRVSSDVIKMAKDRLRQMGQATS